MNRLYKKLSFKIGALIIITELIALACLGIIYILRFTGEIERKVKYQIQIPGTLMAQGVLRYETVENKNILENIIGESVIECIIVGANGKVYYSLSPENRGKNKQDVKVLEGYDELNKEITEPKFYKIKENGISKFVSISPMRLSDGKFLGHLIIFAGTENVATGIGGTGLGTCGDLCRC